MSEASFVEAMRAAMWSSSPNQQLEYLRQAYRALDSAPVTRGDVVNEEFIRKVRGDDPTPSHDAPAPGEDETTPEQRAAAEKLWPILSGEEHREQCGEGFWLRLLWEFAKTTARLAEVERERDEARASLEFERQDLKNIETIRVMAEAQASVLRTAAERALDQLRRDYPNHHDSCACGGCIPARILTAVLEGSTEPTK